MKKNLTAIYFSALAWLLPAIARADTTPADHPLNPLGNTAGGGPELYGRIIRLLLGFTGVASLLFFIWGGVQLLASRGNTDKIKAGRDTIVWAIIGMFVAFSSYIVLRYVIKAVITR